ncbi:type I restriction-modification system subunit M N-terminal domain-containing protein [Escherichia coli]
MTEFEKQKLGKILWAIADKLRGAMNADDFRDYMLAFLFLRYLSDNYEAAAQKELGSDYPRQIDGSVLHATAALVRKQLRRCARIREADAPQGALRDRTPVSVG